MKIKNSWREMALTCASKPWRCGLEIYKEITKVLNYRGNCNCGTSILEVTAGKENLALQNYGMISPNLERIFNGFNRQIIPHLCNAENLSPLTAFEEQKLKNKSAIYRLACQT